METIRFVIFDLDGVFYRGTSPLPGGQEMLTFLEKRGIGYCFLTNNSFSPAYMYAQKLHDFGLQVSKERIITASMLMESFLHTQNISTLHVLGSPHLTTMLSSHFSICANTPDALVVGMDDAMCLADISRALNACGTHTRIFATNGDYFIPRQGRFDLECGAVLDVLRTATKRPITIVGKPSVFAFAFVLKHFGALCATTLMVGDTYETDIKGALDAGLHAAWVATGNALPPQLNESAFKRYASLEALMHAWTH